MRLNGKVAAVTGAGKGIGKGIALKLAEQGARVLVTDYDLELAQRTAEQILQGGGSAHPLKVDVCSYDEVNQIPVIAKSVFDSDLEIMVNNAGIQHVQDVLEIRPEDWDRIMMVNARGVFFGMQAAARVMVGNNRGAIVNMASTMGREGHPLYAHYAASKAAIINLTKSFAKALAPHRIRVNSVAPGIVDTDLWDLCDTQWAHLKGMKKGQPKAERIAQVPMARAGVPGDIASVVEFLVSDEAGFITGECVHINGGTLML